VNFAPFCGFIKFDLPQKKLSFFKKAVSNILKAKRGCQITQVSGSVYKPLFAGIHFHKGG